MKFILSFLLVSAGLVLHAQEQGLPRANDNVVKELFFAGLKEKLSENYTSASGHFNKIIALDPGNAAAYYELATLNYRQNKLLDAGVYLKKAVALAPENAWYLRLEAEVYKRNGNMEALIEVFDRLIKLEPSSSDYYFDRANANFIAGKVEEAKKGYQEIEQKFGPSEQLSLARQRLTLQDNKNSGAGDVAKIIAENPAEIKNYLYLSGLLLEQNKKEEALELLQKAKAIAPDHFEVDLAIADIYQAQKKNDLAILPLKSAFGNAAMPVENKIKIIAAMLPRFRNQTVAKDATALAQIAMQVHPDNAKLQILMGDVYYQQGSLSAAKSAYEQALKISDQLYVAWEKLLAIQTLLGQYQEAVRTGEDALSIYPNQAILYYYHAFALHRNGQNAEAGLEIKSALQLDGDDNNLKAMIFALQAEVFIDQEKLKEADLAFDKAIALAPENYLTLSNYAYYLALRNQNLGKAETLAAKAALALPDNASVMDTYAIVLFKLGKYEQALTAIEKALQNNDASNPVYLEHYGDILFVKGEKEKALLQWQKAKQTGGNSEKLNKKINEKKYIK